jgi:hypothetical protein
MLLSRAFDIKRATKIKKHCRKTHCQKNLLLDILKKISKLQTCPYRSIIDTVDDNNHLDNGLNIVVDVISVALEDFTSAITDNDSSHYKMDHYINDHVIIYNCFNKVASLLFKMELYPLKQSLVTPQYITECTFSDENYTFVDYLATTRGEKKRKHRSATRGASLVENARDRYFCGLTH